MKVKKNTNHVIDVDGMADTFDMLENSKPSKAYLDKHMGPEDSGMDGPRGVFRTATFTIRPHLDRGEEGYELRERVPGSPIPCQPDISDGALFEELMNKCVTDEEHFVLREGYPKEHWGLNGVLYIYVQWFELQEGEKKKVKAKGEGKPTSVEQAFS